MREQPIKILLIEHDVVLARTVARYLDDHGFEVTLDGDAAALAKRAPYDCIVVDLSLPGHERVDVWQSVRDRCHVPVIAITAVGESDRGRAIGQDYLVKPFHPSELALRIGVALRRYRVVEAPPCS